MWAWLVDMVVKRTVNSRRTVQASGSSCLPIDCSFHARASRRLGRLRPVGGSVTSSAVGRNDMHHGKMFDLSEPTSMAVVAGGQSVDVDAGVFIHGSLQFSVYDGGCKLAGDFAVSTSETKGDKRPADVAGGLGLRLLLKHGGICSSLDSALAVRSQFYLSSHTEIFLEKEILEKTFFFFSLSFSFFLPNRSCRLAMFSIKSTFDSLAGETYTQFSPDCRNFSHDGRPPSQRTFRSRHTLHARCREAVIVCYRSLWLGLQKLTSKFGVGELTLNNRNNFEPLSDHIFPVN